MNKNTQEAKTTDKGSRANGKTEAFPASPPPAFNRDDGRKEGVGGTMDRGGGNTVKHLFSVTSKLNDVCHEGDRYDQVDIEWFCINRGYPIVPPEGGIKDYHKNKEGSFIARDRLNELFSEDEAKLLQAYLTTFKDVTMTAIEQVALPIPYNSWSREDMLRDCEGLIGTWVPVGWAKNALPFTVQGCYCMDGAVERNQCVYCPSCGKEIDV